MIGDDYMFLCTECEKIFETPIHWEEDRGEYFGFPAYEDVSGCPYCRGSYIEAHQCNCCGEWIDDIYIKTDDGNRYCLDCYQVMHPGDEE